MEMREVEAVAELRGSDILCIRCPINAAFKDKKTTAHVPFSTLNSAAQRQFLL